MLAQLAQAVRERRLSSVELVRESIERIGRLDPALNAVTAVWPEEALAEAEKLDQRGPEGPLAGLPLLVKDNTDVAGKLTSYASRTMLDRPPAERSEVTVERLVAAGAVPIGRTNLPEFAFQGYTDSKLFGPTRNPWGLDWSPGGSSGGSAAALAAGLAPIATAGDGGGSIRTPAAFCGLAGLKPTARADRTPADPVVDGLLDPGAARGDHRGREAAPPRDARPSARRPDRGADVAVRGRDAQARPRGVPNARCRSAARGRRGTLPCRARRDRGRARPPGRGDLDGVAVPIARPHPRARRATTGSRPLPPRS